MGSSPLKTTSTLQHFLLMYVLETHERRKVISATAWKRSKAELFFLISLTAHYLFSLWTRLYWFPQRVYQWWHTVYSCWQNWGLLLCMRQNVAMPELPTYLSPQEKNVFPISYSFLYSVSLNCTCLMSWRLFFQFYNTPYSSTPSFFPCLQSLLSVSLFFFIQCSSCWHSQRTRRDGGKEPFFAMKYFTFLLPTLTVPATNPRIWSMQ